MSKSDHTRKTILDTALEAATLTGLEDLSIGKLATQTGMSKSGLFAHFNSKEALQLAVVDLAVERFRDMVVLPALKEATSGAQLRALYLNHLNWIEGEMNPEGCPFAGFVMEFDRRDGQVKNRLKVAQSELMSLLEVIAEKAIKNGELTADMHPAVIAFKLYGAALSFQVHYNLFDDKKRARQLAEAVLIDLFPTSIE